VTGPVSAIELDDVTFGYGGDPVLEGVTLAVEEREFLALIGPNGGGKTTLLKLILGLETPARGLVRVLGESPAKARARVGYVPQHTSLPRDFPITVEDVVLMGRLTPASLGPVPGPRAREAAMRALQAVRLLDLRRRRIEDLSGGQRQRVLIARALATEPRILLLDEPTANVDTSVEQDVFELLRGLNAETTIVLVTHDLGFVSQYVSRVACLNRELVCHQTGQITHEMIEKMYGTSVKLVDHHSDI
jgi:zinc transport system ATP-binding protein